MKHFIKAGFGIYIGWEIARCIDVALGKLFGDKLDKFSKKIKDDIAKL